MSASPVRSVWSRVASHVADVASLATTPLSPSHFLELLSPLSATHTMNARVESAWDETADARTLTLRPGRGWRTHRAGQFARVGAAIDGRMVTRTYSLASTPDRADGCVTITVKATPNGKMSRFLVRDVKPGDYVTLDLPQGDFTIPDVKPVKPLFLTAGSGITPVMSMLRTFVSRDAMPDVVHVHYAPIARDVIFAAEIAQIAAAYPRYRFVLVTTREGEANRFTRAQLDAIVPDWSSRETWACGPEGLLDAVEACVTHLHVERFKPKLAPADPNASGGRVRFGLSKKDVEASGNTSLLNVAEAAGVNAPHGCRMGICHSCDSTLVSGCVRDLRTGKRIDEPGTRVQVCVCAAAGDVELSL